VPPPPLCKTFLPPLSCADVEMTRDGVRPATWPLCVLPPSPPLPSSPQLLTTSGYTCSGEFRFQTERCLALVFCRTSIKSRHMLSLSGPVVREGELLTACYTHTPFKPHPLLLPPPEPSSPPHPWQPPCTALSPWEQIKEWKVPSSASHQVHHLLPPFSRCHITESSFTGDQILSA